LPTPAEATPADEALITQVQRREDRRAYGELVRRHQSGVRSLLRRLTRGNDSLADDLAQEAFLKAYLKLASFRGAARFSTWLYRIAYNAFLGHLRRSKGKDLLGEVGEAPDARSATASASELAVDLERAMVHLSEAERAAITLCYSLELTHTEAAAVLDCPVGTVKTHILRGKDKLRARLGAWKGKVSNG
jgi:RNA polymerase sigma-70 factor (ECF subfamily)